MANCCVIRLVSAGVNSQQRWIVNDALLSVGFSSRYPIGKHCCPSFVDCCSGFGPRCHQWRHPHRGGTHRRQTGDNRRHCHPCLGLQWWPSRLPLPSYPHTLRRHRLCLHSPQAKRRDDGNTNKDDPYKVVAQGGSGIVAVITPPPSYLLEPPPPPSSHSCIDFPWKFSTSHTPNGYSATSLSTTIEMDISTRRRQKR